MNFQHLRSNNLTPMGTVPISVIYGFEYPPQFQCAAAKSNQFQCAAGAAAKSNNKRQLFSANDKVVQKIAKVCEYPVPMDDNIKMKRKTKGCLTEIKKYRKPNVISSNGNTIFRVNTSGEQNMTILLSAM